MTLFRWVDRHGTEHLLDGPEQIETEIEAIAAEVDEEVDLLSYCGREAEPTVRNEIRKLTMRLQQLNADCERWNAHALKVAREEAGRIVAEIERIIRDASVIRVVVAIHREQIEGSRAQAADPDLFAGPATQIQRHAMELSEQEPKPPSDVSRADAHAWLMNDPAFYRPVSDEGGWFEWIDNQGGAHRLASPLKIELEIGSAIVRLKSLLPDLRAEFSLENLTELATEYNSLSERVRILYIDLARYEQEQDTRVDQQWETFKEEWKGSRRSSR